jgi:hypothetical protein
MVCVQETGKLLSFRGGAAEVFVADFPLRDTQ